MTFLGVAALLLTCPAIGFGTDATMFRGDARHTGIYEAAGAPKLTGVKWTFKTAGHVIASPAVHGDTLYVGSTGGILYALDRSAGTEKWKFNAKARIASSPAVAGGMVYFGAFDGSLFAVDEATGQQKWQFKTAGEHRFSATHLHGSEPATETMPDPFDCYLSSPLVWNSAVYFGSGDGNVYAVDASAGTLKWKFKTGDVVHASPAIADGVVFIGSWDSYFYALDAAAGTLKWKFKTGEDPDMHNQQGIQSSAAVMDSMVFFGCRDAHLYALDEQTGQQKWSYSTKGSWVIASPAVRDGKVYFTTSDTALFYEAEAKTGNILFSLNFKGWPLFSSPAIAGDTAYFGSTAGTLNAVDLKSQTVAWTFVTEAAKKNGPALTKPDGKPDYESVFASAFYDDIMAGYVKMQAVGPILSSPVVVDNVIYVGSVDGSVYALN